MGDSLPPALQAPRRSRGIKLRGFQWIGLPLMMLVPVLALLGVFGETEGRVAEWGNTLSLAAEYFTRYRYKQINEMKVFVQNLSS